MFGSFKYKSQMEHLGVTLSNSFGKFAPELRAASPAPIAVIASDKHHQAFITIKDGQFVLHMDDADRGSIPYSQFLGPSNGDLAEIPEKVISTLEWVANKKYEQGDYRRSIAFFGDIRRLASGRESLQSLEKWAAKEESDVWWSHCIPLNPSEMNGLFNSLKGLGLPIEYARLRILGARAYQTLIDSGDARFKPIDVSRSYEMGLDALASEKSEEAEQVRTIILGEYRKIN